jgi:hypothetical protein
MACRGVLFAITAEEADRLKAAQGDDAKVLSIVQDEIEAAWDGEHLCETDKAWDSIHRCLTDGKLGFGRVEYPRNLCILGGEQLHNGDDYIVSLLSPDQVKAVSEALKPITQQWLRARYLEIDPEEYGFTLSDEDFDYTWHWFEGVRQFYQKAASDGRWTIFTVDQ